MVSWSPVTSPHRYSYRVLNPGETASQPFTLANSGGSATAMLKITLAGPAALAKTADSCTGKTLAAGKSCRVTVQVRPAQLR